MKSAALSRLRRLLGVAVTAEKVRLASVLAEIDACRARAGEDRTAVLEVDAETIRQRLARSSGREAAAAMAERAGSEELRVAARRAEGLETRPQRQPRQSSSGRSAAPCSSAGLPGMA